MLPWFSEVWQWLLIFNNILNAEGAIMEAQVLEKMDGIVAKHEELKEIISLCNRFDIDINAAKPLELLKQVDTELTTQSTLDFFIEIGRGLLSMELHGILMKGKYMYDEKAYDKSKSIIIENKSLFVTLLTEDIISNSLGNLDKDKNNDENMDDLYHNIIHNVLNFEDFLNAE